MSNHCHDVICIDCGEGWCLRGCSNYGGGPDAERAKDRRDLIVVESVMLEREPRYVGERCSCGSTRVIND